MGAMTLKKHFYCFLAGLGIAGIIVWITVSMFPIPELPPQLTDQQMSIEVAKCAELGLILSVSANRRYFECWPPSEVARER